MNKYGSFIIPFYVFLLCLRIHILQYSFIIIIQKVRHFSSWLHKNPACAGFFILKKPRKLALMRVPKNNKGDAEGGVFCSGSPL